MQLKFSQKQLAGFVISILIFLMLICLGTWQLERMKWKEGILKAVAEQQDAVAQNVSRETFLNISNLEYKKLHVRGELDRAHYALVPVKKGWIQVGKERIEDYGYYILMPLLVEENWVMVDMGWVPSAALRDPKFLQNKWPADITGHARLYKEKGGYFTPPNNLQRNEFYVLLREDLEKFTGHSLAPFYIVNDAPLFGSNYRADDRLDIPNNHLAYAATWYSLACVFLLMMIMSFRKNNGGVNYE